MLRIDKGHALEADVDTTGLALPMPAAILCVPDSATISDCPAQLFIEQQDIGQVGVVNGHAGGGNILRRRLIQTEQTQQRQAQRKKASW
jgi:hypothetical protein